MMRTVMEIEIPITLKCPRGNILYDVKSPRLDKLFQIKCLFSKVFSSLNIINGNNMFNKWLIRMTWTEERPITCLKLPNKHIKSVGKLLLGQSE